MKIPTTSLIRGAALSLALAASSAVLASPSALIDLGKAGNKTGTVGGVTYTYRDWAKA